MQPIAGYATMVLVCLAQVVWAADPLDSWTPQDLFPSGNGIYLSGLAYGDGQFVTVGKAPGNTGYVGIILSSLDGATWTSAKSGTNNPLSAVAYANGQVVAVGGSSTNGVIVTSPDAVTWTSRNTGAGSQLTGIAYGGNQFVAVGYSGIILTSPDGVTWTQRNSGTSSQFNGIAYGNGQFVAVTYGTPGPIFTSADGVTWIQRNFAGAMGLHGIAYGDGHFVAVGDNVIISSPNGVSLWSSLYPGFFSQLTAIAYGNGQFVVVGVGAGSLNIILTSPDWTSRNASISGQFNGIAYGNGEFVACGYPGMILESGKSVVPAPPKLGPPVLLSPGSVQLTVTGLPGQDYVIQGSPNLKDWVLLANVTATNSTPQFSDPAATSSGHRFYRAVWP
ncbi:MAG: WD40/YVTN/BNR-like repeat-containing protein [Limisphaerales bacterium]